MFQDDEAPKDWEVKDEEPPKSLQERWTKEDKEGPNVVTCPSCRQSVPPESLYCLFCGEQIYRPAPPEVGFLRRWFEWFKRLLKK